MALESAEGARGGPHPPLRFSSHDTPENIIKLLEEGIFESCIINYNLRPQEGLSSTARRASRSSDGTVGGGRLECARSSSRAWCRA